MAVDSKPAKQSKGVQNKRDENRQIRYAISMLVAILLQRGGLTAEEANRVRAELGDLDGPR